MKQILPNFISNDQVAYLKKHYIGQNIRIIKDVIEECKANMGIIAFLDFEKAFDSIEWLFLENCLTAVNIGEAILRWFHILYSDINACVINNGFSSEFFSLGKGVR